MHSVAGEFLAGDEKQLNLRKRDAQLVCRGKACWWLQRWVSPVTGTRLLPVLWDRHHVGAHYCQHLQAMFAVTSLAWRMVTRVGYSLQHPLPALQ